MFKRTQFIRPNIKDLQFIGGKLNKNLFIWINVFFAHFFPILISCESLSDHELLEFVGQGN